MAFLDGTEDDLQHKSYVTRPKSSGKDPASGFKMSRRVLQPMNFGRLGQDAASSSSQPRSSDTAASQPGT